MSIYIAGIDMPTSQPGCEVIIRIKPDGTVCNAQGMLLDATATQFNPIGNLNDDICNAIKYAHIIRCKDCGYAEEDLKYPEYRYCRLHDQSKKEDGFCDEGYRYETN